jgi:hypothetical protein
LERVLQKHIQSQCHVAARHVEPIEQQIVLTVSYRQSEGLRRALAQGVASLYTRSEIRNECCLTFLLPIILTFLFFLGFVCATF